MISRQHNCDAFHFAVFALIKRKGHEPGDTQRLRMRRAKREGESAAVSAVPIGRAAAVACQVR